MNEVRICSRPGCYRSFSLTGKIGRPFKYCEEHRTGTMVTKPKANAFHRYGRSDGYGSTETNRKRNFQERIMSQLKRLIGTERLDENRSYVFLCGNQSDKNSFVELARRTVVSSDSQLIGIDLSEKAIMGNMIAYPKVKWVHGDMCSARGVHAMYTGKLAKVIDFDYHASLLTNRARDCIETLLEVAPQDSVLVLNVMVSGRGVPKQDYWETIAILEQIPGFKTWDVQWSDVYRSDKDTSTFRTFILTRVEEKS